MYLLAYQQFGLAYLFLLAHYDFMQTVEYYEYLTTKCLSLWRLFFCAKYIPFTRNVMVIGVDLPRTRMFRRLASRCESHVTIYCVTCVSRSVKLILSPGLGFQYKYGISLEILHVDFITPKSPGMWSALKNWPFQCWDICTWDTNQCTSRWRLYLSKL